MDKKFVLITTDNQKRGVFGGYLKEDNSPDYVILNEARMVIYWIEELRGVLGLASMGPQSGCRISLPVEEIKLFGVTSVTQCSEQSVKQWEKNIWN